MSMLIRPAVAGVIAGASLAGVYVGVVAALSGWTPLLNQFRQGWYFLLPLWLGFGAQVGLHVSLRRLVHARRPSRLPVAATGTSSGAAMLACCAHYLAVLVPAIGAGGIASLAGQFQTELFWLALLVNAAGIGWQLARRRTARRQPGSFRYEEAAV